MDRSGVFFWDKGRLMNIQELRAEIGRLNDRNADILQLVEQPVEDRPGKLTNEQISDEYESNEEKIKTLQEKVDELQTWEDRRQQVADRATQLDASAGLPAPPQPPGQAVGSDMRGVHSDRGTPAYLGRQYAVPQNIRGERHGMGPQERAYRLGMWGLFVAQASLPNRYKFPGAERFVREQGMIVHGEGAADTSGSHVLVPDEFSADLIDLKEARGVVRQMFNREPMARETKTFPRRSSGLTAYAVGENAAGTESTSSFDDIELVARKWMVLTRMSKELDEDNAVNLGDHLAGEISYAFADKEDEAGFNGDGTSTYHGILGVRTRLQDVDLSGTDSAGLITGTGNAYSELTLGDFESVVGILPTFGDTPSTAWVCHRRFYFETMKRLELASGGVTSMEVSDGAGARRPRPLFLGYPVVFSQVFPSTEANSQVCAVLADFSISATFGDRRGETIEFDDTVSVGGQSVWERDQIAIKGTERFDIVVHEFGDSSNAGAIVGLETAGS